MVERCLDYLSVKPIVLRLCGWVQTTDRHALREIGLQLLQQTGSSIFTEPELVAANLPPEGNEETNPFFDSFVSAVGTSSPTLLPTSHLHALVPLLLTLNRPIIVILDAFDLFALHPRQSLLYCLFDTAQNCRASSDNRGIAIIGTTSRADTIQLLEKRVKSRFSGRTIRTAPPCDLQKCMALVRDILQPSIPIDYQTDGDGWDQVWNASVEEFLEDENTLKVIQETFSVTRDMKILIRIMVTNYTSIRFTCLISR
jgi:origin recognition complex subunit 4